MPAVWLRDVAKAARVSVSAASHAINQTGTLSTKTREHILAVAQQLGYRRTPHLSAIAARRFRPHSQLLPLAMAQFSEKASRGFNTPETLFHTEAESLGMSCLEPVTIRSRVDLVQSLASWRAQGVEGILIGHSFLPNWMHPDELRDFSVVASGDVSGEFPFHRVEPDWFKAASDCYLQLTRSGCQRIGAALMVMDPLSEHDQLRIGAILAAARQFRKRPPLLQARTHSEIVPWFQETRPDGLVIFALPTAYALLESGIQAPEDVRIALMFKASLTDQWYTPFAGPVFDYQQIARRTIRVMYDLITHHERGQPDYPQVIRLQMPWSPGASLPNNIGQRRGFSSRKGQARTPPAVDPN